MRLSIGGKHWTLREVPGLEDFGECDPPNRRGKAIRIRAGLKDQERLDTLIHEMLHASVWDLSEETVAQVAEDITRALWRLGYRQT